MKFKETLSSEDDLAPVPPRGFVPVDQIPADAESPDQEVMRREEEGENSSPVADPVTSFATENPANEDEEMPQAWESHPAMAGASLSVPAEMAAGDDERAVRETDRLSMLSRLKNWFYQDTAHVRTHSEKKERPKGAPTVRGDERDAA